MSKSLFEALNGLQRFQLEKSIVRRDASMRQWQQASSDCLQLKQLGALQAMQLRQFYERGGYYLAYGAGLFEQMADSERRLILRNKERDALLEELRQEDAAVGSWFRKVKTTRVALDLLRARERAEHQKREERLLEDVMAMRAFGN
ncbi:hypothetical protein ACTSKR_08515 [Chitinibacteraceae bacterium HSL-7]